MNPAAATSSEPFNPNYLDERALRAALCSGTHAPVLSAYFGAQIYAELRELALQAVAVQPTRNAPKVYVLPGLLGSKLGVSRHSHSELFWLDPATLLTGKVTELAIGKRRSLRCQGVMLPGYLKLKLMLEIAGFNAVFHAYDWRRSARELGKQLADILATDKAEVMLVGHSMGGLIARAALKHLAGAKVTRVVQIGTPNLGSYALVQALRACYPTVRKLGAVDPLHTAEQLTQQVFRSFYSLYEMLPAKTHTATLDLFNINHWPQDALLPNAVRLKLGRRLQRHLVVADRRCHTIVGMEQLTATGLSTRDGQFVYELTTAGDGTVPASLAQWAGAQHWYVAETHGQMPRNSAVCQATIDLLRHETTTVLPREWQIDRSDKLERSEAELRTVLDGKVRWDQLPLSERRDLLEPIITPTFAALCQPVANQR